MKLQHTTLFSTAAALAVLTGTANAAVILDTGKIISGGPLTGAGLIVDTTNESAADEPTGSDWAQDADDGWENVSSTSIGFQANKPG